MPERIQRKRTKGWRMPEGAVYVGRPSRWGNPFTPSPPLRHRGVVIGPAVDAAAVVERYRQCIADNDRGGRFNYGVPTSADVRAELAGRDLVCWCPLDHPCHADVLLGIANETGGRA